MAIVVLIYSLIFLTNKKGHLTVPLNSLSIHPYMQLIWIPLSGVAARVSLPSEEFELTVICLTVSSF